MPNRSFLSRYGYTLVTLSLFALALVGQWVAGWYAYVDEQQAHGAGIDATQYLLQLTRDTLENWQSEFLQLVWQIAGLAFLLHVGSPQSKEGNQRLEAKVDALIRIADPRTGEDVIDTLDRRFMR